MDLRWRRRNSSSRSALTDKCGGHGLRGVSSVEGQLFPSSPLAIDEAGRSSAGYQHLSRRAWSFAPAGRSLFSPTSRSRPCSAGRSAPAGPAPAGGGTPGGEAGSAGDLPSFRETPPPALRRPGVGALERAPGLPRHRYVEASVRLMSPAYRRMPSLLEFQQPCAASKSS